MTSKSLVAAIVGFVMLSAAASPVLAGTKDDVRELQARMAQMEQAAAAQSAATVRIGQLEEQIQQLTGQIEELTFALDQANSRLDAVSAALAGDVYAQGEMTVTDPGFAPARQGPVALGPAGDPIADQINQGASSASAGSAGGAIELPINPDAAFEYASSFLLKGDYQQAKAGVRALCRSFPKSSAHAGRAIPSR